MMQKVAIIGSCGAGKSTLAVNLGKKLNLPVIHIEILFNTSGIFLGYIVLKLRIN